MLPTGSAPITSMSGFCSRRYRATPVIVPPVPTPHTKCVSLPPDWRQAMQELGCTTLHLDHGRVTPASLAALAQEGVNVVWEDCWVGGPRPAASSRCEEPVGGDIVLRLQKTAGSDRSKFVSMGFSLVGTPGAAPFLATVYVDRVASVSFIAALPETERQAVLDEVRALIAGTPEIAGKPALSMPYLTTMYWCRAGAR